VTEFFDAALRYAARGWRVLPLRPGGKLPATQHGLLDASSTLSDLSDWWRKMPNANVGIATGEVSRMVVLDVDTAKGGIGSLGTLGRLPSTLTARTGSGGWHLFFAHPGRAVPNSVEKLGPGLDVRGDGGYVVAAPSIHPCGDRYEWVDEEAGLSILPPDLLLRMAPLPVEPRPMAPLKRTYGDGSRYGRAALAAETVEVATCGSGGRNHRLNEAALKLGSLVAGGELPLATVEMALLEAALACGLPEGEALATITSGLRAGMAQPRAAA
jgi:hypothetical protein